MKFYGIALIAVICFAGIFWENKISVQKRSAEIYTVDTLATGLIVPWEIVFLPGKTMIFTERSGKIRIFRNEQLVAKPALIVNDIETTKKMGLLGMCIHPQFSKNKYIYLSYNYRKENNALLKIVRYQFLNDTLINPTVLLDNINASPNHTGCRLRFGPDEKLYITTGDADRPILAQNLKSLNGKILRVNEDGTIPSDNPFVNNDTARKEIWTYGHRNTQGIAFDPVTGQLYNSEHGPTGGDEINVIVKGNNYGWPIIHHQDSKEGMRSPLLEYTPSIGPSQITFYNADAFPSLKKKLLVACLRGEKIMQVGLAKNKIIADGNLLEKGYGRIRALTVGPDGYIYFSTSQNDPPEGSPGPGYDMVLRLRPATAPPPAKNSYERKTELQKQTVKKSISKQNPTLTTYIQLCASCHGADLKGTERAKSMMDDKWEYGSKRKDLIKNIAEGIIEKGMPAWEGTLTKKEIENQADFILLRTNKK